MCSLGYETARRMDGRTKRTDGRSFRARAGSSALLLYLSPFLVSLLFSSSLRETDRRSGQRVTDAREKE